MANFGYRWQGEFVNLTSRHFPKDLHERLKMYAKGKGISLEKAINVTIDVGLDRLEQIREERANG